MDPSLDKHIMNSLQMIEQVCRDNSEHLMRINQQMKHLMFLMAKDAEPFNKMPKGESKIAPCERCGSMTEKSSMLSKSEIEGNDITIFKLCKLCFYGKRQSGKTEQSLSQ